MRQTILLALFRHLRIGKTPAPSWHSRNSLQERGFLIMKHAIILAAAMVNIAAGPPSHMQAPRRPASSAVARYDLNINVLAIESLKAADAAAGGRTGAPEAARRIPDRDEHR